MQLKGGGGGYSRREPKNRPPIIDIEGVIAGTNISGVMNVPPATNQVQPTNQMANQDQRTNQAVTTRQVQLVSQNATAKPVTVRDKSPDSQRIDGSPRSV